MYCSIVSAIASASSSSEYSWSESRLKSGDHNSTPCHALPEIRDKQSIGFISKKGKNLARKSNILASVPDDRYAVSNGSGYAVLICWDEYAVLDRKTDTSYSTVDQNSGMEVGWIRRIQELDTAYWGFLGVGTTLDIFQNINSIS
ncbi:hypothetical protein Tco_0888757 [Tanacetum coccineum]